MRRTFGLLAMIAVLSSAAPAAGEVEAEVSIDRIDWFSSGKCSVFLTLKNPNAEPLTVTGSVVLEQGADSTLGTVAAAFPAAPPRGQSSIEVPVSLDALGGRPCVPPLTAAFRGETLHLQGSNETVQQPLWLNVTTDFRGDPH